MPEKPNKDWRQLLVEWGPWLALATLLVVCCVSSPGFRKPQNLINITRQVSYSGLIALGMTVVIIGGGIDLSVGSLLAFSGTLGLLAMNHCGSAWGGLFVAIAVTLGAGLAGGMLNGLLVNVGKIPPFIATLGTMSIFRSLTLQLANAGTVSTPNGLYGDFGGAILLGIPLPAWLLFLL
ncbi:MAG: ABC transporter permease, partial [Victivallales bacterium]|nr:ABC transporter permease [Victivallales bacterium]